MSSVYTRDKIFAELSNAPAPSLYDVCGRPEPYETQTYITLVKEGEKHCYKPKVRKISKMEITNFKISSQNITMNYT